MLVRNTANRNDSTMSRRLVADDDVVCVDVLKLLSDDAETGLLEEIVVAG